MGKYAADTAMIPLENFGGRHEKLFDNPLVHYTSIPTLFKILRKNSFKLNRIDKVNDLEEKFRMLDYDNFRRVFVSCFSYDEKESIPMWQIYTAKETGIMLKIYFNNNTPVEELFVKSEMTSNTDIKYPLMHSDAIFQSRSHWQIKYDAIKVNYTDIPKKPVIMNVIEENKKYTILEHLGLEKSTAWVHEEEIRFRAIVEHMQSDGDDELEEIDCLYAKINFGTIKKIMVIFSPWIDKKDWEDIYEDFLKKQNISTQFEFANSDLYGKIK